MDTPSKAMVFADAIVSEVVESVHKKSESEPGSEKEKLEFYAQAFRFAFQILARKLLVIYDRETVQKFCEQALTADVNQPKKSDSSH